jgi:hypothetical protein
MQAVSLEMRAPVGVLHAGDGDSHGGFLLVRMRWVYLRLILLRDKYVKMAIIDP